ncbi:dihydroorotate dehydrogenase electron transfer subunit [Candidatus Roizmanbacteria bacterium CG09_land_8_20_14_0_10_41_9]|uniref:Dihydroorotate dehydrogenase electron transfer subunit n=1 Tax=Candidatus Roizmanbacteria bacterium CG09_land_8_20_14_0_10_41_9 TaxID=1974850 RepID=A0A2H0WTF3_9BACT|nr:MAG: dihydroorotate dehydrogenase electron transfer subunit [Candidatus Roizmanbacteria bacterium CG09_land_8_20_14_0_10_41_9]
MKNQYITARIRSIQKETEHVKTFVLDTSLPSKPGQYVMVWIPQKNEKPFGIVSPDPLTLTIAQVGPFTKEIHSLKIGDLMTFRGPYGSSFHYDSGNYLLVGGGYGIVPLFFLASRILKKKKSTVTVVIGAKTKRDLVFLNRFKKLGCSTYASTDDGTFGEKGFAGNMVKKLLEKKSFKKIYTCGPRPMMEQVVILAEKYHIPSEVSMESFFKCGGIGLCGECSLKGYLVCKDGPVFDGSLLIP